MIIQAMGRWREVHWFILSNSVFHSQYALICYTLTLTFTPSKFYFSISKRLQFHIS